MWEDRWKGHNLLCQLMHGGKICDRCRSALPCPSLAWLSPRLSSCIYHCASHRKWDALRSAKTHMMTETQ